MGFVLLSQSELALACLIVMVGDVIDSIAYKNCALHMFELNMNMKYEMEEMQLAIGCEHVLYSCGDIGLDQIAEEMADQTDCGTKSSSS